MQPVAPVHDTAFSAVPPGVSGIGVLTNVQAAPFHDSAKVNWVGLPGPPSLPTAMHCAGPPPVPAVHETPFSVAAVWANVGVAVSAHLVPFHASASGCGTVRPVFAWKIWVSPTAMQSVLLTHEMAVSSAPPPRSPGDGAGMIVHDVPFQASARV